MNSSFSVTSLDVLVVDFILVETGVMNVSFPFSEPGSVQYLLPLILDGLLWLLQVPSGFLRSPGLPGLMGTLLEGWGALPES